MPANPGHFDEARRPPVVRLDRPGGTPAVLTPPGDASSPEHAKAKIIAALTFACTLLSLYDLYLLSAGV